MKKTKADKTREAPYRSSGLAIKSIASAIAGIGIIILRINFTIKNETLNSLFGIICGPVVLLCFWFALFVVIGLIDIKGKKQKCTPAGKGKLVPFEQVLALAEEEGGVDMWIAVQYATITRGDTDMQPDSEPQRSQTNLHIGATCDYDRRIDKFFDKQYFAGEETFADFDAYKDCLSKYVTDGKLYVIEVDGVPAEKMLP